MTSLFDLSGRVALVTGSSAGIGNALAAGLADAGATVVINGRDPRRLEAARVALHERHPGRVVTADFDVTDEGAVAAGVDAVERMVGPLDVLINNAGVQHREPMLTVDLEDWERVVRVDLTAPFIVGRAVARGMVERGRGKIVNIASVQADLARPGIAPYTAAKGGVRNLTRAMAAEWAGLGVQANAIAPGYIETELTAPLVADPTFSAWVTGRTPAGRWGRVDDLVGTAVWLSSSGSDFVNGQTIFVDGGMTVVV